MKKLLISVSLAFTCSISFSQINSNTFIQQSDSLYAKGVEYYNEGKYKEAIILFQESYNIDSTIFNKDDRRIEHLITWIANSYYKSGDTISAKELDVDYIIPPTDRRIMVEIDSLSDLADLFTEQGDWNNNLQLRIKIADKISSIFGQKSFNYGDILNTIGASYNLIGDIDMAMQYFEQALEIMNDLFPSLPPYCQQIKKNIANLYIEIGDYENAYKYYSEILEIYQSTYGNISLQYAEILKGLGNVFLIGGDYNSALNNFKEVAEIYTATIGKSCMEYAIILNSIGVIYDNLADYVNAKEYYSKSFEITKSILSENHYYCATLLSNRASTEINIGEYDNAIKDLFQALEIIKIGMGNTAVQCIAIYNNIANVYGYSNNINKSIEYIRKAIDLAELNYGKNHRTYIQSITNLGSIYSSIGDYENAEKYYIEAMTLEKEILKRNFSVMTLNERKHYWDAHNMIFALVPAINYYLPDDTTSPQFSYDAELVTKGLLLSSEVEFNNLISESNNKKLIAEYENLKILEQIFNFEIEKPIEERTFNCDSIDCEMQKIEKHIVTNCKQYGDFTRSIAINWKDVYNSLSNNDVAIEFSNFTDNNDSTFYVALVLTKATGTPVYIRLFEESSIARLQRGYAPAKMSNPNDEERGAASFSNKRFGMYESTGLYESLWEPLEKYFPENPRIYFAPSGALHQIGIEYAPISHEQTISDKYEIYRISSTRQLAMRAKTLPIKKSILYGGVYYDSDTATMKQESERFSSRGSEQYISFAEFNKDENRGSLNYLPGTKQEVEKIQENLKKKRIKTTLYEGSQANEESFKALSGSDISLIHIATHGFFIDGDLQLSGDESLIQSGLLFSGANIAWQNKQLPNNVDDGILTAKEISTLDLKKTDLVVLSACQTALGETTYEGVFGLQRGFKKAGVKTIIMSLWSVDDNATLLMMTEFYSNLVKGMSKREAFITAQNKVKTTPGFEHPRYWAAFIMLDGNE